jgi:hypothetical protein
MAYVSGRIFAGKNALLTTTAQAIDTQTPNCREALIQSDPSNTTNVIVGSASEQHIVLIPGQAVTIPIISLSLVYAKMASGTGQVNWLTRD